MHLRSQLTRPTDMCAPALRLRRMWCSAVRGSGTRSHEKIYEIAAEQAGVAMDRCLFVDDRLENINAAVRLGMTGVHYREPADLRGSLGLLLGN